MPAARCVGAAPSRRRVAFALSGAPFWPWCLWRLLGAVPGVTGTLCFVGRVGGRLDAWRGVVGRWCWILLVSFLRCLNFHRSRKTTLFPLVGASLGSEQTAGVAQQALESARLFPVPARVTVRLSFASSAGCRLLANSCRRAGPVRKKW